MKTKIILLAAISLVIMSCAKQDEVFRLAPLSTFAIKPDAGAWSTTASASVNRVSDANAFLSPLDIVKRTTCMRITMNNGVEGTRGFAPLQRDTVSEVPSLKMWATDIINTDMEYVPEFIESTGCVLEIWGEGSAQTCPKDTVAYIPNSVLSAAKDSILDAYIKQDTKTIYRIFNDAFTFKPCTGEQYRALKSAGLN